MHRHESEVVEPLVLANGRRQMVTPGFGQRVELRGGVATSTSSIAVDSAPPRPPAQSWPPIRHRRRFQHC
jgi:hypothetical protein